PYAEPPSSAGSMPRSSRTSMSSAARGVSATCSARCSAAAGAQFRRHLESDSAQVLIASAHHRRFLGAAVVFFRRGSGLARLYSLAGHLDGRGLGIGSALAAAVEVAARARHCHALRLEVRGDNDRAIALYERLGYRRIGLLPRYYEDGADGWRYEKVLK